MRAEGLIGLWANVSLDGIGRPMRVYSVSKPRLNQLEHDLIRLKIAIKYGLPYVTDDELAADLTMLLPGGGKLHWEIDTGKVPYAEVVEERFRVYVPCPDSVIWVSCGLGRTSAEMRMEGLRSRAEAIRDLAWFTTLTNIRQDALGSIFTDWHGTVKTFAELGE